jgi:putative transcriptional regulator
MTNGYRYTESGLDNVYLVNGYEPIDTPRGRQMIIRDIDGLHRAIGMFIITQRKDLNGPELRFLRHEMLMSQATLANLLSVSEQAVRRWEQGRTEKIPKPAESLIRLLYSEHVGEDNHEIRRLLRRIADLEDSIDQQRMKQDETGKWRATAADTSLAA